MKIDGEGFANFSIADDSLGNAAKAKALGVNFMAWLVGDKMLLIYKHMLPSEGLEKGIHKVLLMPLKSRQLISSRLKLLVLML